MESKICTKCKEEKPATLEYFSKHKKTKSGLNSWCRLCCTNKLKISKNYLSKQNSEINYQWKYNTKGVYGIFENGECLYVGESKRINDRWSQHKSWIRNPEIAPESNKLLGQYLSKHIHLIFGIIEECDNHKEKEKQYINQLKPKYNTYGI
jgi:hypothetical protein